MFSDKLKNQEDTTLGNPYLLTVLGLWQNKIEDLIASRVDECTSSGLKSKHKSKGTNIQGIILWQGYSLWKYNPEIIRVTVL